MKHDFTSQLVCFPCQAGLTLEAQEEVDSKVRTGRLTCTACGKVYPIKGYVPRFVDSEKYVTSFSVQRTHVRKHFHEYVSDRSGYEKFSPITGISVDEVKQGLTLEVGCGYGRFLDVVQSLGGTIVGVDLSTESIELAQEFVGLRPNVNLVQADVFQLPFRPNHFDRAFSIGVLHHTPDTRRAFEHVVQQVKKGGRVSIWVYHPLDKVPDNRWRVITTRLPHSVLYTFCVLNQAMFSWIRALPHGRRFSQIIPGGTPRKGNSFWQRVMGDFDSLSPTFAHVHSSEEVVEWFNQAGLDGVEALPRRSAVTGFKSR